ncbi:hypothetical protein VNO77_22190 [Canavalia gladiata]|uniref:Uncharacterized protein n=1 Tax=Canavalia gladiata TaxID=3824 RepID=A0AAN9L2L8_CANGL
MSKGISVFSQARTKLEFQKKSRGISVFPQESNRAYATKHRHCCRGSFPLRLLPLHLCIGLPSSATGVCRENGASDSRPRDRGAVVSAGLQCASPEIGETDFSTSGDFAERLWFSLPPSRVLCFVRKHSPPCCNRFALQFRLNQRKEEANLDEAAIAATGAAFLLQSCYDLGLASSETRSAAAKGQKPSIRNKGIQHALGSYEKIF